jgi:uncharacterized protein YbcI
MLSAVSNAVVRSYRVALGRGPTRVRAVQASGDVLLCILQDTLTPAERRLVALGEHEQVRLARALLVRSMEDDLRDAVQAASRRRVSAVISGFNPWEDTATELFLLHPEEEEPPRR